MEPGHWAGDRWLIGLAGPFGAGDPPHSRAGAFSRANEAEGDATPSEVVDAFIELVGAPRDDES